jgi:hypothetical protein
VSLLPREYTDELHDVDAAELHEHQGGELFDVELYERGVSPSRASTSRSGSGSVSGP